MNRKKTDSGGFFVCFVLFLCVCCLISLMFCPVHVYRPGNIRRLGGPMAGPGGGRGRGMNLLR